MIADTTVICSTLIVLLDEVENVGTSGMNLLLKVGPMPSLVDIAVVTKIDRMSQAEPEVFRARIQDVAPNTMVREVKVLHGIGVDPLATEILQTSEVKPLMPRIWR